MHSERITSGLSVDQEAKFQCLIRHLQLNDGASSTSTSVLVTPPSPDRTSLLTLYFPEETNEQGIYVEIENMIDGVVPHYKYSNKMFVVDMSQITNYVQPKTVFPLYTFRVLAIEMVEHVQLVPAPRLLIDVTHDDDVFKGVITNHGRV